MRPIVICVVIAFVLAVLLAPSVVLAGDPPDGIIVDPFAPTVAKIINNEFSIAPPDIYVKTPKGEQPPLHVPPQNPGG